MSSVVAQASTPATATRTAAAPIPDTVRAAARGSRSCDHRVLRGIMVAEVRLATAPEQNVKLGVRF